MTDGLSAIVFVLVVLAIYAVLLADPPAFDLHDHPPKGPSDD